MAIHALSTAAPARPLLPLRGPDGRFVKAEAALAEARTADDLLREIAQEIDRQLDAAQPNLQLEPLLPAASAARTLHLRRQLAQAAEPDTAALARDLHMRRQASAALEWGFAFLDALDLGPAALDMIDGAIAEMDEENGDTDLEPWLAEVAHFAGGITATALDAEDDSEEDEATALESFGRGFTASGGDDSEDSDPAEDSDPPERDDHYGTEDDAFPWRREPSLVAFAVSVAHV